jgi:hypothetical protein
MPGQAGAPLGRTPTPVDPTRVVRCCASFAKDPNCPENNTAVQFINFSAAAVQFDLFCAPCQGALFCPVKIR